MAEKPMKPIIKPKQIAVKVKKLDLSKFPGTKSNAKVTKQKGKK